MALLVEVAKLIADEIPEVEGRSFAVSEVMPFNKDTIVPKLPISVTALLNENGTQSRNGGGKIELTDRVLIQFLFNPVKYKDSEDRDLPFFAFYDYEPLRDKVLTLLHGWRSSRNVGLSFRSLDVESDDHAVYIAMTFEAVDQWCPHEQEAAGTIRQIQTNILTPKSVYDPDADECQEADNGCP